MSRRAARRSALFALYKWDLTGKLELDPDADDFTRETVRAVQAEASSGTSCESRSTNSKRATSRPRSRSTRP